MTKYKPLPDFEEISEFIKYDPDSGYLYRIKTTSSNPHVSRLINSKSKQGYIKVLFKREIYLGHRIAWLLYYKSDPDQYSIDHIDGNSLNNKISNLRLATVAQNQWNRKVHKNSKTGVTGVIWLEKHKRFIAGINYLGKRYHIGCFQNFEEAVLARRQKEIELYGSFSRLYS